MGHAQEPARHDPVEQVLPQRPQFMASVCRSAHPAPGQAMRPVGHWQAPRTQLPPVPQEVSQVPQCPGLLCGSIHSSAPVGVLH